MLERWIWGPIMKKGLLVLFIVFNVVCLHAEDLIPRRVLVLCDPSIPAIAGDILFSSITDYHPLVAVNENETRHNTIEVRQESDGIYFVLKEDGRVLDELTSPSSIIESLTNLSAACEKVARTWESRLAMVPPLINEEYQYRQERLSEEADLEIRLATDYQLSLWLPVSLVYDIGNSAVFYRWPIGMDFAWFWKENIGVTASFAYNHDPDNDITRLTPSVGVQFRTIGRVSMEFGLRFGAMIDLDGAITAAVEFLPVISWNMTDHWSARTSFLSYNVPFSMFASGDGGENDQLNLLHLGVAYRW